MQVGSTTENRKQRRARKALSRRERRKQKKVRFASPIISAWLALSGMPAAAHADSVAQAQSETRFRYMYYTEHQSDGTERMTINAPMASVRQRVTDDLTLEGTFTYDSISGASPFYLDSVSGASEIGIDDTRYEGVFRISQRVDDTIVGSTFSMSDEDDYKSLAGAMDVNHAFDGGNTQVAASVSHSEDQVSSTLYPLLGGNRQTTSVSAGVTQVVDESSIINSSVSYTYDSGYLNDPYKTFDDRPSERNAFVWMNRYNYYLESTDSSIHNDLRFYSDDWGIVSQTLEVSYYQPFWESWLLRPSIRYYSQHGATFFKDVFPPLLDQTGYYSADQRLGTYGSLTMGMKLQRDFGESWSIDFSANWMEQRTEWSLEGGSGSNYQALHAFFGGVGLVNRF